MVVPLTMFNFLLCPVRSDWKSQTQQHSGRSHLFNLSQANSSSNISSSPEIKIEQQTGRMYQCLSSQHASEELGQGLLVVIFPNLGSIAMRQRGNVGKKIWDKRDETSCCVAGIGFVRNLCFVFERPKIGVIFPAQTCHIWWKATRITRWFLSIFSAHAAQTYVLLLKFNPSVMLTCLVAVEGGGRVIWVTHRLPHWWRIQITVGKIQGWQKERPGL